jgi:hypothetical protein
MFLQKPANTAGTRQAEFFRIFKHFSGFEFSLLPSSIYLQPPAINENRSPWIHGKAK